MGNGNGISVDENLHTTPIVITKHVILEEDHITTSRLIQILAFNLALAYHLEVLKKPSLSMIEDAVQLYKIVLDTMKTNVNNIAQNNSFKRARRRVNRDGFEKIVNENLIHLSEL